MLQYIHKKYKDVKIQEAEKINFMKFIGWDEKTFNENMESKNNS